MVCCRSHPAFNSGAKAFRLLRTTDTFMSGLLWSVNSKFSEQQLAWPRSVIMKVLYLSSVRWIKWCLVIWRLNEALYCFNLNTETESTSTISCLFNPNTGQCPAEILSQISRILHKMTILQCNSEHRYFTKHVLGIFLNKLVLMFIYWIELETTFPFS